MGVSDVARLHLEVFDPKQREALRQVGPVATAERFALGGGGAAALHLGHRHTVDLDFFTRESFSDSIGLAERLVAAGVPFRAREARDGTLHGSVGDVKVSFLRQEGRELAPPVDIPGTGAKALSLHDVAAQKVLAVAARGDKKDFVDLHAIGRERLSVGQIMESYARKFGEESVPHARRALVYFRDADAQPAPRMTGRFDWDVAKATITRWAGEWDRVRSASRTPDRTVEISRVR